MRSLLVCFLLFYVYALPSLTPQKSQIEVYLSPVSSRINFAEGDHFIIDFMMTHKGGN
jgi:hypothetical protein